VTICSSPLRVPNLVGRKNERTRRELRSAEEVGLAAESDEIVIERPGVVIDMPLLT
jgi:hypothetical protein